MRVSGYRVAGVAHSMEELYAVVCVWLVGLYIYLLGWSIKQKLSKRSHNLIDQIKEHVTLSFLQVARIP